jgi:hypothetical protein
MNGNKEELDALRRIEELLSQAQNAEAPEAASARIEGDVQNQGVPVDPEMIKTAEANAGDSQNVLETISGILQQILTSLQSVENTISRMVD